MKQGRLNILLIEDSEYDAYFVRRATEKDGSGHTVRVVRDGQEAIHYLQGHGQFADRQKFPSPNVILCDLKMPGMDGFEFLRWLREHPECGIIPTIVYSSSPLERDAQAAYRLGANAYIVKPPTLEELVDILTALYEFWSRCVCPPIQGNC